MDRLEDLRYTMESCNHCGQCKWVAGPRTKGWRFAEICPIHMRYHFDAYSGQGLLNISRELLDGELEYEPGLIDLIYSCTMCGACDIACKSIRDMEVLDTIAALRARCVEDGEGPPLPLARAATSIMQHHNIFGRPHAERGAWRGVRGFDEGGTGPVPAPTATSEIAYFVGCSASYLQTGIARDTSRILAAGGWDFQLLDSDERCCGRLLWQSGQWQAAAEQVERNLATFREHGVKTVVTSCAECYGTFRGIYPRFAEVDVEVLHISEVIVRMLREGTLKLDKQIDLNVTYHDPCMLGRLSEPYVPWHGEIKAFGLHEPPKQWRRGHDGVYDAPREVLRAIPGLTLTEMVRHAENALCCGAGGGVGATNPELARWTANERLDEAAATGAGTIVSSCPHCRSNFTAALPDREGTMACLDLTALVARAL